MMDNITHIKHFTDNDLDGLGCKLLSKLAFGQQNNDYHLDVKVSGRQTIEDDFRLFVESCEYQLYDYVIMTDTSVSEDLFTLADRRFGDKFILIDHHKTASHLNNMYQWSNVVVSKHNQLECGTSLFYEFLTKHGLFNYLSEGQKTALDIFVEKVRRYDTWEWKDKYNDIEAKQLNRLFYLIGEDLFMERYYYTFCEARKDVSVTFSEGKWLEMFSEFDKGILDVDEYRFRNYFMKKAKELIIREIQVGDKLLHYGMVFADQYHSELGNKLCETYKSIDFVMLVDVANNKMSFRATKDYVDVSVIAKMFNGGGHAKASGGYFKDDFKDITVGIIERQTDNFHVQQAIKKHICDTQLQVIDDSVKQEALVLQSKQDTEHKVKQSQHKRYKKSIWKRAKDMLHI